MSFKPIQPSQQNVASFRRKLLELVRRLQMDYERELKPLIEKMTAEQKKSIGKAAENAEAIFSTDAVKYLTAYEVARQLGTLKSKVIRDIGLNKIEGVINQDGEYLIPEDSVRPYGVMIGKISEDMTLMDKFNDRLNKLRRKYEDFMLIYQKVAEQEAEKIYKESRDKFRKQFSEAVGINVLNILAEKGLRAAYDNQVKANVNLIKSIPDKYFSDIQTMVTNSITGQQVIEGGLTNAIQEMTKVSKTKAKLIARDQSSKAASTYSHLRMQNLGVLGYQWNNSRDKRVAGNPGGYYPNVDPNSKYHGNHWEREGKYYLFQPMRNPPKAPDGKPFRQPPPDGPPGMPIQCRCYADPVIPDFED